MAQHMMAARQIKTGFQQDVLPLRQEFAAAIVFPIVRTDAATAKIYFFACNVPFDLVVYFHIPVDYPRKIVAATVRTFFGFFPAICV